MTILRVGESLMKEQISERTADFLFYYLLGVTLEDIENLNEEEVISVCANRAYLDMNRTLKFNNACEAKDRKSFCHSICKLMTEEVLKMLKDSDIDQFDAWHRDTCRQIIKTATKYPELKGKKVLDRIENRYDNSERFYYGQAQKWLNMTIKYMWITGKWNKKLQLLLPVLHVPVDSYIIEAVWNTDGWEDVIEGILVKDKRKSGQFNSNKVVPWSKWNEKQYIDFQKNLRGKLKTQQKPIEWEEKTWIEIAKQRAN